jgi:hypothetical protein
MHPTIERFKQAVDARSETMLQEILAEDVRFLPPTYWKTWVGRDAVAAVLGHVIEVFSEFRYRRIMGDGGDWALEFQCRVGDLDAVGADLITLDGDGLISVFEVVMRPYKSVGALRDAMNARVMTDPRFLKFREALK